MQSGALCGVVGSLDFFFFYQRQSKMTRMCAVEDVRFNRHGAFHKTSVDQLLSPVLTRGATFMPPFLQAFLFVLYFSIIAAHEVNTQETVLLWFAWVWRSLQVGFKTERHDEFHCGFPKEHLSLGQTASAQLEGSQWIDM